MGKFSPMMEQYLKIKEQNKDSILFFRLGDFYEMFFDDAKIASEELELTLTGKMCGTDERAPMCGVPYHSCEAYIARLLARGHKVAICEQTEEVTKGKKLVDRDVVRIITPGTVVENEMLDETKNNYIASVYLESDGAAVCFIDISTGEAHLCELSGGELAEQIMVELAKFSPVEVLVNSAVAENKETYAYMSESLHVSVEIRDDLFETKRAKEGLDKHFESVAENNFDCLENGLSRLCTGALFAYLYETQKTSLSHINKIEIYSRDQYMLLDVSARRNLEISRTMRSEEKRGSFFWAIDKTKTSMGSRMLRSWIEKPLMDVSMINERLDAVQDFFENPITREETGESLRSVRDIERLLGKVVCNKANGRDLNAMAKTFLAIPSIKEKLSEFSAPLLRKLNSRISALSEICELIDSAISEEAPLSVREGEIIRDGYNEEVDRLRDIMKNGKKYLADLAAREKEATGIKNLKVGYNRVFGYYIEVTKSSLDEVPERYIRKQTLTNGERFITEELKELESSILGAQEKLCRLEYQLFKDICNEVCEETATIRDTAEALATLDVLVNFACIATRYGYTRPTVNSGEKIVIKDGRHPVVERVVKDVLFVPNDTHLDCGENRMAIITGPNMAGKSTYMRQVALITLMAQAGSFVPAKSAEIGVVDRIFTRIGASDDLSSGKSTFMVEMNEVAEIIKKATRKSLIVLDEIGRGTSTFDGMAIARAVIEYVADKKCIGAKTLFATHYHELTELEGKISGVKNYNIVVKKHGFDITFLRKIVRGSADDSYGIEVARLAGIPDSLILRAKEILEGLEAQRVIPVADFESAKEEVCTSSGAGIITELSHMDVSTLSPLEAISILFDLAKRAREAE